MVGAPSLGKENDQVGAVGGGVRRVIRRFLPHRLATPDGLCCCVMEGAEEIGVAASVPSVV